MRSSGTCGREDQKADQDRRNSWKLHTEDWLASTLGDLSRFGYIGNPAVISATSFLTDALTESDSGWFITAAINSPIFFISASFMPRVVNAGVPRRMPDATNGFCVSNGIVFLLTVILTSSSAFSAALPVIPLPSIKTSTNS